MSRTALWALGMLLFASTVSAKRVEAKLVKAIELQALRTGETSLGNLTLEEEDEQDTANTALEEEEEEEEDEEKEEMVDEEPTESDTGGISLKVATLNALAKDKTSRSLASFPKITEATLTKKKNKWLQKKLDQSFEKGYDIFAVQESDIAEARASKLDCSIEWAETIKGRTGDTQHLCFNRNTIEKKGCGPEKAGIKSCKFIHKKGPTITVMAAHATPTFEKAIEEYANQVATTDYNLVGNPPDVILMDANQPGDEALAALVKLLPQESSKYSVFPADPSVVTTMKSRFKYGKLYQVFEGTCEIDRKCGDREQGFYHLPAKLDDGTPINTCGALKASGKCGDMMKKADEDLWPEKERVCKYASRICGSTQKPDFYENELKPFLKAKKMKSDDINLKRYLSLLKSVISEGIVDGEAQEDVIIYKTAYRLQASAVHPGKGEEEGLQKKFMKEGKKNGFPNIKWPSDHFMVAAKLEIS